MATYVQQEPIPTASSNDSYNVDKVVQSVTNASKRLSQISTNTNNSNKKRKSQNRIGPWKLGRTLGRGSTGRVRLAKNINNGKLAAIKIVPKSNFKKLENPKYKRASNDGLPYGIEREIIIMKLINHPNIMGLYDVWENKNDLYLILEYIEGGELFDYLIKRGKLQEFEAINYFKQIINGISYLHQFNICHRDLKPENLLLDFNKNIKIADFGMAALEVNEKLLETSCGSPHYASPEIVAGKLYHGAPSDIWSCGIILFALLTGHLPFDDENIRKLLLKVQSGKFIMPSNLTFEAKDLISKMLKVNPDDRITINDILRHPLLTKYPNPKNSYNSIDFNNLNIKPIDSYNRIDKEILKNLSILFHNCDENLIVSKLLSPSTNAEKVFYFLLMKYRNDHIEDNINDFNLGMDLVNLQSSISQTNLNSHNNSTSTTNLNNSDSPKRVLNDITHGNNANVNTHAVKYSNSFKNSRSFKKSRSFKNSNSFKASNSFNKKKSIKLNDHVTLSRDPLPLPASKSKTKLKSTKSVKSQLTRQLTDTKLDLLNQFEQQGSYDTDGKENDAARDNLSRNKSVGKANREKGHERKLSNMEKHERKLANRVHEINEARALRYEKEEQERIAKQKQEELVKLKAEEERANKELEIRQKEAIDRLLKHQSKLDFNDLAASSPKRRNVTEPPAPPSLDPRAAGVNSLLRAKSLASPSSYASIRRSGINENTSKVLERLGIDVKPPHASADFTNSNNTSRRSLSGTKNSSFVGSIKTSSSKRLSDYVESENKENVSIQEFNKIEHPTAPVLPAAAPPTMKYRSLLSNIDETKPIKTKEINKLNQINELSQNSAAARARKPNASIPKTPTDIKTETVTTPNKVSPTKMTIIQPEQAPSFDQSTTSIFANKSADRRSLIPNPRFSRFSFNGLLNKFDPDTEIYNNVQSSGTVLKKSKSNLKKSSTINLKGLGIGKDEFISVSIDDNDEEDTNNCSTLIKNAINDQDFDYMDNYSNSEFPSEIISNRTAEIGYRGRPSLIQKRKDSESNYSYSHSSQTEDDDEAEGGDEFGHESMNILDNSSLADTINVEEENHSGNEFAFDQTEDQEHGDDMDQSTLHQSSKIVSHEVDSNGEFVNGPDGDRSIHSKAESYFSRRRPSANPSSKHASVKHESAGGEPSIHKSVAHESLGPKSRHSREQHARYQLEDQPPQPVSIITGTTKGEPRSVQTDAIDTIPPQRVTPKPKSQPIEILPPKPTNNTVFRRLSLKPKRQAPKPPGGITRRDQDEPKENWFMKIIHSLGSSDKKQPKSKNIHTINSMLDSTKLLEIIRTTLELKKIEGSLSHFDIDEEFGIIDGVIPANFGNGRKLKFKIEIVDLIDKSCLHLIKVRGSSKSFNNLIDIVSFIIKRNESD